MFGYQDLVVDFRGIPKMKEYAPVILDVTHSLQQPNQPSGVTGGHPELIETIAKAGIANLVSSSEFITIVLNLKQSKTFPPRPCLF